MQILDNINSTVRDDLKKIMRKGSKVSIAAACFSIYAYQELKKQLEGVEELQFIFTSPTFITEKHRKQKESFTYLEYPGNEVYMVQNLKLNSADSGFRV